MYLWCDLGKSVWSRTCDLFSFLFNWSVHLERYILLKNCQIFGFDEMSSHLCIFALFYTVLPSPTINLIFSATIGIIMISVFMNSCAIKCNMSGNSKQNKSLLVCLFPLVRFKWIWHVKIRISSKCNHEICNIHVSIYHDSLRTVMNM